MTLRPTLALTALRRLSLRQMSSSASVPGIVSRLMSNAETHETKEATRVLATGKSCTYGEIAAKTGRIAQKLSPGGESLSGKRVAFLASPSDDFVSTLFAVWALGGVAVPLCTSHPASEISYVLQDSGASIVAAQPGAFSDLAQPLASDVGAAFVTIKDEEENTTDAISPTAVSPSDPALLIYTSGTTGRPKGVSVRHESLQAQIGDLVDAWKWTHDDRILHVLPLHHVHGLVNKLLCALWSGASVEFCKFDAGLIWKRFADKESDALTLFMAVPTVYAKLIETYETELSEQERGAGANGAAAMRLQVSGSAALPSPVADKWEAITGHKLLERYGMTEFAMALSNPYEPASARKRASVGKPLPSATVRIVPEDAEGSGEEVPDGQEGEIRVKGVIVFNEYWGKPEATAETFDKDGYFKTGDIGVRDPDDGMVSIVGRASVDVIKSSGYKISALEIERVLLGHDDIAEAFVVGVPSETFGQTIAAVVRVKPGCGEMTLEELREWAKPHLAAYKIPRELLLVDEIEKKRDRQGEQKAAFGSLLVSRECDDVL